MNVNLIRNKHCLWLIFVLSVMCSPAYAEAPQTVTVQAAATLVEAPCSVSTESAAIDVDLDETIAKGLYLSPEGAKVPFKIVLTDCDPTIMNQFALKIDGTHDDERVEDLAIAPTSTAKGIAISFSLPDSTGGEIPLPLGEYSKQIQMEPERGDYPITINASVVGKPSAIEARNIIAGDFSATATYSIEYY